MGKWLEVYSKRLGGTEREMGKKGKGTGRKEKKKVISKLSSKSEG